MDHGCVIKICWQWVINFPYWCYPLPLFNNWHDWSFSKGKSNDQWYLLTLHNNSSTTILVQVHPHNPQQHSSFIFNVLYVLSVRVDCAAAVGCWWWWYISLLLSLMTMRIKKKQHQYPLLILTFFLLLFLIVVNDDGNNNKGTISSLIFLLPPLLLPLLCVDIYSHTQNINQTDLVRLKQLLCQRCCGAPLKSTVLYGAASRIDWKSKNARDTSKVLY